ncbi:MAG: hypothetical protein HYY06_27855, partial [Deltaproteobacteria bacterium]|nr:hypothetical protein [Deltaproteobacteria bacterium]
TGEGSSLVTTASWDAGLGVITELRDYNGQATTIEYDGLSRVTSIVRPGCDEAAVRYEYLLGADTGRAINEVITRSNEECGDGEPEDVASSLESHAYVDGLGRLPLSCLFVVLLGALVRPPSPPRSRATASVPRIA